MRRSAAEAESLERQWSSSIGTVITDSAVEPRTTLGPRWWIIAAVWIALVLLATFAACPAARAQEVRQEYVRVTWYAEPGRMADGNVVREGAAACSAWMPFGTVLEFPDGRQVVCEDRGHGDWYWHGWIDVYGDSSVSRAYGDYAWVNVLRWGW